ncbi:DUF6804 family protein [Polaribacter atrinae]|uniref:DUF6804 family protein n=1 Tax=Polaribacter atrinae TaxID=1333662 RepID=UPI0030FAD08F
MAYQSKEKKNKTELIIFTSLALLFQPFYKVSLGKQLWNIIDLVVAVGLILNLLIKGKKEQL